MESETLRVRRLPLDMPNVRLALAMSLVRLSAVAQAPRLSRRRLNKLRTARQARNMRRHSDPFARPDLPILDRTSLDWLQNIL